MACHDILSVRPPSRVVQRSKESTTPLLVRCFCSIGTFRTETLCLAPHWAHVIADRYNHAAEDMLALPARSLVACIRIRSMPKGFVPYRAIGPLSSSRHKLRTETFSQRKQEVRSRQPMTSARGDQGWAPQWQVQPREDRDMSSKVFVTRFSSSTTTTPFCSGGGPSMSSNPSITCSDRDGTYDWLSSVNGIMTLEPL